MEIVAVDLGGTHVRFGIMKIQGGRIEPSGDVLTLKVRDHVSFDAAWCRFVQTAGGKSPRAAAIAVACPVNGDMVRLTNNPWTIDRNRLRRDLGLDRVTLVNDLGAVGHAVAHLQPESMRHVTGPDQPLPRDGVISIVGPGTGLGVAQVLCRGGQAHVMETEGGHVDFAPLDHIDDAILARLRPRLRRVSVERIVSGPGLVNIYEGLAAMTGKPVTITDDRTLWTAALGGTDSLAVMALERFLMILGSVAGDIVLTQGARCVVLAGGIGTRIADVLPGSAFRARFTAKGRFERFMNSVPVKLITDPHAGLIGATAAYMEEHPI